MASLANDVVYSGHRAHQRGSQNLMLPCRCLQTNMLCQEGLGIPPERWTVDCAVCEVCLPAHAKRLMLCLRSFTCMTPGVQQQPPCLEQRSNGQVAFASTQRGTYQPCTSPCSRLYRDLAFVTTNECISAMQFLAPFIMVKKGGKLPEGNINDWFFEKGDLKSSLPGRMPAGDSTYSFGAREYVHITAHVVSSLAHAVSGGVISAVVPCLMDGLFEQLHSGSA